MENKADGWVAWHPEHGSLDQTIYETSSEVTSDFSMKHVVAGWIPRPVRLQFLDEPKSEDRTLGLLKRVYRKHNRDDMSIGWVELGEELRDGLCEIMGDDAFSEWSESLTEQNKKTIP